MAEPVNPSGWIFARVLALLFLLGLPAGCAGTQKVRETFTLPAGENTVVLTADNWSFTPRSITVRAGENLILQVENTSKSDHSITIESPGGRTLRTVDLPARETTTVTIPLGEAGRYPFYCDKPYHTTLGMKGEIWARQGEDKGPPDPHPSRPLP